MEYHAADIHPHISKEDLAMGAVDLYAEYLGETTVSPLIPNSTRMEEAVKVVKEVAPTIVDAISNHLFPLSPSPSGGSDHPDVTVGHSDVVASYPLETIVVLPPVHNTTNFIRPTSSNPVNYRIELELIKLKD
jgi:hypothetical protein